MLEIDLAGRRALITGAGQGIGRVIAGTLATAGASVLVNDVVHDRAVAVAEEINATAGQAAAACFDVSSWPEVRASFAAAGPVDIVVNNAGNAGFGGFGFTPVAETEPEEWEPYLRVNLYGVMHCIRAALPGMIASGWGRVVTIISDAARTGEPRLAAYAAAKAGAAGFSRSVAKEVGRHGITVNCIALGTMGPPGGDADEPAPDPRTMELLSRYVIRRRGEPADAAAMAAFLASPMAAWITGQTIPVNGGYSMAL